MLSPPFSVYVSIMNFNKLRAPYVGADLLASGKPDTYPDEFVKTHYIQPAFGSDAIKTASDL